MLLTEEFRYLEVLIFVKELEKFMEGVGSLIKFLFWW